MISGTGLFSNRRISFALLTRRLVALLAFLALMPMVAGCSNGTASEEPVDDGAIVESSAPDDEVPDPSDSAASGGTSAAADGATSVSDATTTDTKSGEGAVGGGEVSSDLSGPVATVKDYFNAMNNLDVSAMFACCDSQTNAIYDSLTGLLSMLLGSASGDEVDVAGYIETFLPSLAAGSGIESGQYGTVHITPRDFSGNIDGDWATIDCTCDVTTTINGKKQTYQTYEEFTLVEQPAGWKIYLADQLQEALPEAANSTLDFFLG